MHIGETERIVYVEPLVLPTAVPEPTEEPIPAEKPEREPVAVP